MFLLGQEHAGVEPRTKFHRHGTLSRLCRVVQGKISTHVAQNFWLSVSPGETSLEPGGIDKSGLTASDRDHP